MDEKILTTLHTLGAKGQPKTRGIGGGCIGESFKVEFDSNAFFVKIDSDIASLRAESMALSLMARTKTVKVPQSLSFGETSTSKGYLVCEYLDMKPLSGANQAVLGRQLAEMHLESMGMENEHKGKFGLSFDNFCGSTRQINTQCDDWGEFYWQHRIKYLCKQIDDTELNELADRLEGCIGGLMRSAGDIKPSLIHGDLWAGNAAQTHSTPVIFDPAAYFAHHEAELGMMVLFGGFSKACFDAYHKLIPKSPGFSERQELYTLYHVLNHYNIFGSGYRSQGLSIMRSLL